MAQLTQDFGGTGGHGGGGARSSGMGIPICSRLAALMGGSLLVQDRAAGTAEARAGAAAPPPVHGTTFTLRLPLLLVHPAHGSGGGVPAPAHNSTGAPEQAPDPAPVAGSRVLVVDDSPANRRLAAFLLRQLGCVPGEADDGDAVLPALLAAGAPYDAVLMDMIMERINGDASLVILRGAGQRLPVLACTGNATARDAERYVALGFAGVLPKPFTRRMLHAVLAEVLATPRAQA